MVLADEADPFLARDGRLLFVAFLRQVVDVNVYIRAQRCQWGGWSGFEQALTSPNG
jgi:hypothetical protein